MQDIVLWLKYEMGERERERERERGGGGGGSNKPSGLYSN